MTNYYYEELPLKKIIAVEKEIEKRLTKAECDLAIAYQTGPAYIKLNMKNGRTLYVVRDRKLNDDRHTCHVQLLDENLDVIESNVYEEDATAPLMMIAVAILRKA